MATKSSDDYVRGGVQAMAQNDLGKAKMLLGMAIEADKKNVDAYYNLGAVELYLGNPKLAIEAYEQALKLSPSDYEVWYNLGTVYIGLSLYDKAVKCFQKSLDINPYYQNALNNLGVAYNYLGNLKASIKVLKKSIEVNPDNASVYNNIGVAYSKSGLPAEASKNFTKAIELNPDYPSAYNNLGNALQQLGIYDEAQEHYKKALEFDGNYVEALINIAGNYHERKKLKLAIKYYKKAHKVAPKNAEVLYHLVHVLMQTCDWKQVRKYKKISDRLGGFEDPLMNIMHSDDKKQNFEVAKKWSDRLALVTKPLKPRKLRRRKKIRIGYVNNFQERPVGLLVKDMFALHDRSKFITYAFSYGSAPGASLREMIARDVDRFFDIANMTNLDAAKLVLDNKIDILIDLKGYTKGHRMAVFAHRPAPIQVSYLGYPGTTGASFFDYVITDKILTPPQDQKYYSENFLYMPHCYQVVSQPEIRHYDIPRSKYGLPKDKPVYMSFNQTLKIDEEMYKVWLMIIKKTDGVLWLHRGNKMAEKNLKLYALQNNVDPDKIIFADTVGFEEHMNRIKLADISLDTRIYSGGATTSHTLQAGVPVITLIGKHYLSRMTASIIQAAGLPELVTHSLEKYKELAISLGKNSEKIKKIKSQLTKNKNKSPLFDTARFVKDLEDNYASIWNEKLKKTK